MSPAKHCFLPHVYLVQLMLKGLMFGRDVISFRLNGVVNSAGYCCEHHLCKRAKRCLHGSGAAVYCRHQLHCWDVHLNLCLCGPASVNAALVSAFLGKLYLVPSGALVHAAKSSALVHAAKSSSMPLPSAFCDLHFPSLKNAHISNFLPGHVHW